MTSRDIIHLSTSSREELVDITQRIKGVVAESGVRRIVCTILPAN